MRLWGFLAAILIAVAVPGLAWADCVPPVPIAKPGNTGSPFATRDVTRLDTQTSDAVKLTGGCVDGTIIGHNAAAAGHFTELTTGGPATCDGVVNASGGTMTVGLPTLTGSGFTAADVGKRVMVYSAGSKFLLGTIAINAAGTGYGVNDLVTLAGGTFSAAVVVRVAAVGGSGDITAIETVNNGIYTATTGTLTTGSSVRTLAGTGLATGLQAGLGSGATFTATWVRAPLSTTITGFTNATTVTLGASASASVASVAYAYGTDKTTQIQAGLTANIPVVLPRGICVHTSPITLANKNRLRGKGIGGGTSALTAINTTLLYLGDQMDDAQITTTADGFLLGDIHLDGAFLAAQALRERGATFGTVTRLKTERHTQVGIDLHGTTSGGNSNHDFDHITISDNEDYGLESVHGLWTGYPNTADIDNDPNQLHFNDLRINIQTAVGKKGVPWQCGVTDHVTVVYGRFRGPTAVPGFEALGNNWNVNGHCRQVVFLGADVGEGGYLGRATGFASGAGMNHIYFYDLENGSPVWVNESGAKLRASDNSGRNSFVGLLRTNFADLQEPNNSTFVAMVQDSPSKTIGDIITTGGGIYDVIAAWTGTTGEWRVIGALDATSGIAFPRLAKTANYTVSANDNGTYFDNNAAAGQVDFTLPTPATGLNYCFSAIASQTLRVVASGVKIGVGSNESATGGYLSTSSPYSTVCVKAHSSVRWIVSQMTGAWTVDGSEIADFMSTSFAPIDSLAKVATSGLSKTSDTTFAIVPGLQVTLLAGKTYSCRGTLSVTSGAGGGIKVKAVAGGGLTQTSSRFSAIGWNGTTVVSHPEITDISGAILSNNAVYTTIELEGVIVVNAGGNLQIHAAQSTSDLTAATVAANSHFGCRRVA